MHVSTGHAETRTCFFVLVHCLVTDRQTFFIISKCQVYDGHLEQRSCYSRRVSRNIAVIDLSLEVIERLRIFSFVSFNNSIEIIRSSKR